MINIFYVFDFSFVYWVAFGLVTFAIVLGTRSWLDDKQMPMNFWKWGLLAFWYIATLLAISAPFVVMGEGEPAAGWRMFAFNIPICGVAGLIVYRILAMGRQKA